MATFNVSLSEFDNKSIRNHLVLNTYSHALKVFNPYIEMLHQGESKFKIIKKLLEVYSENLVSLYLHEFNNLNNLNNGVYNSQAFYTTWENSNVSISIEDFEDFQNSMSEEFSDLFMKIEHKLFSIKQIDQNGDAVHLMFKLDDHFKDQNLEYKYNSLKKAICFYIKGN